MFVYLRVHRAGPAGDSPLDHAARAHGKYIIHVAMADGQQQLCFSCDENVRLEGDFLCRSCKEEYRKCYECGQRERNHPFKLCSVCYQQLRDGPGAVPIPAPTSTVTTATNHLPAPLGKDYCRYKDSTSEYAERVLRKINLWEA